MATQIPSPPKVGMVSLGCPKALVDSERILTQLRSDGYDMSADYAGADVVLVNTCGFLASAKEESLEAIGEAMAENGRVIVTGCMGNEADLIMKRFPDVLAVTGAHQYEDVVTAVHAAAPAARGAFVDLVPEAGLKLTPRHYSYLKISEGCNHRCSFCIIPSLRGDLVSRRPDAILREAEKLVEAGTKELLVISQDTSAYGVDIRHQPRQWNGPTGQGREVRAHMTDLAAALGELRTPEGQGVWTRLHYVYPYPHVDKVIPLMAERKITPYLDIPFQHAAPNVLKRMKRPANEAKVLQRVKSWRDICPDLTIRSTFVVGFPGETEEDFEATLELIRKVEFGQAYSFKYSTRPGTPAAEKPQMPEDVMAERLSRLQALLTQQQRKIQDDMVGRTVGVLFEKPGRIDGQMIGKSDYLHAVYADAPADVLGQVRQVRITVAGTNSLGGELVR